MVNYNLIALSYLISSVLFILSLKGLSHPETARRGNSFGMIGMALAIATTFFLMKELTSTNGYVLTLVMILIGGAIGTVLAKKVEMTAMPQLVAAMHSLIGLAAVLIAVAASLPPAAQLRRLPTATLLAEE